MRLRIYLSERDFLLLKRISQDFLASTAVTAADILHHALPIAAERLAASLGMTRSEWEQITREHQIARVMPTPSDIEELD